MIVNPLLSNSYAGTKALCATTDERISVAESVLSRAPRERALPRGTAGDFSAGYVTGPIINWMAGNCENQSQCS